MPKKPKRPTRAGEPKKPRLAGPKLIDWRPRYLERLAEKHGNRTAAADGVVNYTTVWEERKKNPEFARAELALVDQGTDALEDEAHRRAFNGVEQITYGPDGKTIRSVRVEYSDALLLRILETRRTHWRQKSTVDVNNSTTFLTRADRKKALEEARKNRDQPLD